MTTVELRGLEKVYPDGHVAVRGVDLRIEDGEFFVLLGPSGCGKTTVLRMIAGLERPTGGDVRVDGTSVVDAKTSDRDLAMLFQTNALYPHMDVRTNLAFPLKMAGVPVRRIRQLVDAVAERFLLTDLLDRKPSRLSGGQQQRVAMGRALIRNPSLLLMDEPMSNIDAKLRTELRGLLAAQHRRNPVTTVFVTHDQVEALALGQRLAIMRNGRVVQCGTPDDLYRRPVDLFVATFVGTPQMNLLVGRLTSAERLRLGDHELEIGGLSRRSPELDDQVGREIAVGLRPEALRIDDGDGPHVEIVDVEWSGPEQFAHVSLGVPGVVRSDAGWTATPGPTTVVTVADPTTTVDLFRPRSLRIDVGQIHLFDLESERCLGGGSPTVSASAQPASSTSARS
jgi:multiple sugar transport system ATP-binding protein